MTFKKFVNTAEIEDDDVTAFKKWMAKGKLPASNSPDAHIIFFNFSPSISDEVIIGYKKAMMAYFSYDKIYSTKPIKITNKISWKLLIESNYIFTTTLRTFLYLIFYNSTYSFSSQLIF